MKRLTDNLESIADQIRNTFSAKDAAREKALPLCREVIRHCSQAIRAVHRQEFDQAKTRLQSASGLLNEATQAVIAYNELSNTNCIRDAQKEFAEGNITLALVTGNPPPGPDELGIDPAAYLNGLGEAVGELRRYVLDSIRREDLSRCEELLSAMDDVYSILITMDFPDAITGGLRRTTDMVRSVLERTRSDLTLIMSQNELENKLRKLEGNIR
jgi:translin